MILSIFKSGVVGLAAGTLLGSIAAWNIQGSKIEVLQAEGKILRQNINLELEHSKKVLALKEKRFEEALSQSTIKWKEQESAYTSTLNRMQHDRDSYRSKLLSRIAESSRNPDELCFSREGFESAVQRLDESLSGIIGQCLDTEARLTITRDWYNSIRDKK